MSYSRLVPILCICNVMFTSSTYIVYSDFVQNFSMLSARNDNTESKCSLKSIRMLKLQEHFPTRDGSGVTSQTYWPTEFNRPSCNTKRTAKLEMYLE
jgi:hypothetical protein